MNKLIPLMIFSMFMLQGCIWSIIQGVATLGWGYYQNDKIEEIKDKLEEVKKEKEE